jgi:metal-responsive CopG/Arc/MetJ family transcriptional regulator
MKKVLISLTEEQYQRLEALAAKMGISKSEAMRIAVRTFDVFRTAEEQGDEWMRRSASGEEIVVKFIN